ncbi:hypothetical protein OF829_07960 [Sphingomonas sp. LB-2]|uniref:hypothetical protein n=1 Tax=Sphingomonas caeni TaxID=2984949 RepID=UPI002231636D|nr:hypothetical protein [Sphingomonas caeni]MCW3847172.1 hypothetical protein [Sphingomonas caeni]
MLILRSFGSVLAGFIVIVLLSTLTDQIMHATGIIPDGPMWNPWHNALALFYRCVFAVGGGWLTARLAPRNPMRHVVILGVIGTLLGVLGVVATAGMELGPRWYPIALAISALPTCWLGGWLQQRKG